MPPSPLLQAILPNWPVIGVVVFAFILGKLNFSVLLLPILLYFLYVSHSLRHFTSECVYFELFGHLATSLSALLPMASSAVQEFF